ncbi:MAG: hypothetical protein WAU86_21840 [Oricola sp.]
MALDEIDAPGLVHRSTETANASKSLSCRVSGRRTGFRFIRKSSIAENSLTAADARKEKCPAQAGHLRISGVRPGYFQSRMSTK